jgi:hypothetical protein
MFLTEPLPPGLALKQDKFNLPKQSLQASTFLYFSLFE